METKLVTSRKWNEPKIEVFLSNDEIGAKLSLPDFINALVDEIGNPTPLLTKEQLRSKLEIASAAVLHEMRSKTIHIL